MKKITKKLWQTDSDGLHPLVEDFTIGDDYIFDQQLLPYDIQASIAHATMLHKMKIITKKELLQAQKGLQEILLQWGKGSFVIAKNQEDGHTSIEQYLTEKHGDIGRKIHTGRSRNDQSLVMIRLFMKEQLLVIKKEINTLISALKKQSKKCKKIPMPGYTHLQKAMPTTVGIWLDSYLSALQDFLILLDATTKFINQNPLGSASGFGIQNFPLKRGLTTQKLGFSKTQQNPMYCGLSRGYFENIVLQTLSPPMILAGKFATDMLLFTTQEFDFISLPKNFTTGSSIMPQKKNYDVFEIMRGNVKVYGAYQQEIQHIVSSIGGGYQRDLQLTKKPFVLGINLCFRTLQLLSAIIPVLQVHKEKLIQSMTEDIFVTNEVYELVKQGKSFREAYVQIKEKWNT
ncbi:MAG: lyase family protein [Chitinophagaceae bacterium]